MMDLGDDVGEEEIRDKEAFQPWTPHNIQLKKICLKPKLREDDVFVIQTCDEQDVKDVLFIHSSIPKIRQFINYMVDIDLQDQFNLQFLTSFQ
jgi:hypothetical protein